jgi:hypothetical protein
VAENAIQLSQNRPDGPYILSKTIFVSQNQRLTSSFKNNIPPPSQKKTPLNGLPFKCELVLKWLVLSSQKKNREKNKNKILSSKQTQKRYWVIFKYIGTTEAFVSDTYIRTIMQQKLKITEIAKIGGFEGYSWKNKIPKLEVAAIEIMVYVGIAVTIWELFIINESDLICDNKMKGKIQTSKQIY